MSFVSQQSTLTLLLAHSEFVAPELQYPIARRQTSFPPSAICDTLLAPSARLHIPTKQKHIPRFLCDADSSQWKCLAPENWTVFAQVQETYRIKWLPHISHWTIVWLDTVHTGIWYETYVLNVQSILIWNIYY